MDRRNKIDDFLRKELEPGRIPFNGDHWRMMEERLERDSSRKRWGTFWTWFASAGLIVLSFTVIRPEMDRLVLVNGLPISTSGEVTQPRYDVNASLGFTLPVDASDDAPVEIAMITPAVVENYPVGYARTSTTSRRPEFQHAPKRVKNKPYEPAKAVERPVISEDVSNTKKGAPVNGNQTDQETPIQAGDPTVLYKLRNSLTEQTPDENLTSAAEAFRNKKAGLAGINGDVPVLPLAGVTPVTEETDSVPEYHAVVNHDAERRDPTMPIKTDPAKRTREWARNIILFVGPQFNSRLLKGENNEYIRERENHERQLISLEAGVNVSVQLSKNAWLTSGVNYYSIREKASYAPQIDTTYYVQYKRYWEVQNNSYWTFTDSVYLAGKWYRTDSTYHVVIDSVYRSKSDTSVFVSNRPGYNDKILLQRTEIPLLYVREYSYRRVKFGWMAGIGLERLIYRSGRYLQEYGNFESLRSNPIYREWNWNVHLGLFADYRINQTWAIGVQPNTRFPLRSALYNQDYRLNHHTFSLRLRARYYF